MHDVAVASKNYKKFIGLVKNALLKYDNNYSRKIIQRTCISARYLEVNVNNIYQKSLIKKKEYHNN